MSSKGPLRGWTKALIAFPTSFLIAVYVWAAMQRVPDVVYTLKWGALTLLALLLPLVARVVTLRGLPFVLIFAPWFVLTMAQQIVIGPTARGIGVAGGYLGLLIMAFVLFPSLFSSFTRLDQFERWTIHALGVMCLVSVADGLQHLPEAIVGGGDRFRVRWGFEHVNTGGYVGYLGAVLALRQVLIGRWRYLAPSLVFLGVLLTAGSRGAILAFLMAVVVVLLLELVARYRARGVLALAGLGALGAVFAVQMGLGDAVSVHDLGRATSGRLEGWRRALEHLQGPREWLVGQGAGQNVNYIGTSAFVGGSSDSFMIDLITRSGWVGLAIWLATIAAIAVALAARYPAVARRGLAAERRHLAFATGLAASALLASVFEGFTFSVGTPYALMLWAVVGIALLSPLDSAPNSATGVTRIIPSVRRFS